jgi:hypothetical protein
VQGSSGYDPNSEKKKGSEFQVTIKYPATIWCNNSTIPFLPDHESQMDFSALALSAVYDILW